MPTHDSDTASTYHQQHVAAFQRLENYPWDSDLDFQTGLQAILGSHPSTEQAEHLTLHARCFYFTRYPILYAHIPVSCNADPSFISAKTTFPSIVTLTGHGDLSNLFLLPMESLSQPQRPILPFSAIVLRGLIRPFGMS